MKDFKKRLKNAAQEEDGSSLVELVVAVPLIALLLGVVFSSISLTYSFQRVTFERLNISDSYVYANNELSKAYNCVMVEQSAEKIREQTINDKYPTATEVLACNDTTGSSASVRVNVVDRSVAPQKIIESRIIEVLMD